LLIPRVKVDNASSLVTATFVPKGENSEKLSGRNGDNSARMNS